MTHPGYIAAGYGLSAAAIAGYAFWIGARSRSLLAGDRAPVAAPVTDPSAADAVPAGFGETDEAATDAGADVKADLNGPAAVDRLL